VKVKLAQQACLEELHKNVDEIATEAAAANDGTSKMAAKLKAVQFRLRHEEKARKKAEGDVEATRNESDARQARVLANVGRLLDDQKQAAEEEHQGAPEARLDISVDERFNFLVGLVAHLLHFLMSLFTHLSHQIPRRGVREDRQGWAAVIRGDSLSADGSVRRKL
jgi:hypothetical protein